MFEGSAPFVPLRAMVRASPTRFLDIGADWGWLDASLQLRAGPLDARHELPWGLELEWRTGRLSAFDHDPVRRVSLYGVRAEAYPALGRLEKIDSYGVLTVGVSTGTRLHYVFVPLSLATDPVDPVDPHRLSALELARSETRLELSIGVHGRSKPMAMTVALLPWFLLDRGRVRGAACVRCGLEFQSIDVAWGLGLSVSGSLYWEKD